MYMNVISFKNGKTLGFQTETPYSADKTSSEWSVVTDARSDQILSFRGSEVVTIATAKVSENQTVKKRSKTEKKPAFSMSVKTE